VNIAREIVDLSRKVILLKERESNPLKAIGVEVDAAVLVILAWLGRDADSFIREEELDDSNDNDDDDDDDDDSFKLAAEDERRVRIHVFEFMEKALEIAKEQNMYSSLSASFGGSGAISGSHSFRESVRSASTNSHRNIQEEPAAPSSSSSSSTTTIATTTLPNENISDADAGKGKKVNESEHTVNLVSDEEEEEEQKEQRGKKEMVSPYEGEADGKDNTVTGDISSSSPPLFGEGSFKVTFGVERGMEFTLLKN
jgi:hypothetical protein